MGLLLNGAVMKRESLFSACGGDLFGFLWQKKRVCVCEEGCVGVQELQLHEHFYEQKEGYLSVWLLQRHSAKHDMRMKCPRLVTAAGFGFSVTGKTVWSGMKVKLILNCFRAIRIFLFGNCRRFCFFFFSFLIN